MNLEQQQLLKKAEDNLQDANLLSEEGLYDVAVSRAYYTMFYVAEAFLLVENLSFSKHAAVISKFGEYFARTNRVPRELHRYLIQAQESRIKADYDSSTTATLSEARIHIERAAVFIDIAYRQLA